MAHPTKMLLPSLHNNANPDHAEISQLIQKLNKLNRTNGAKPSLTPTLSQSETDNTDCFESSMFPAATLKTEESYPTPSLPSLTTHSEWTCDDNIGVIHDLDDDDDVSETYTNTKSPSPKGSTDTDAKTKLKHDVDDVLMIYKQLSCDSDDSMPSAISLSVDDEEIVIHTQQHRRGKHTKAKQSKQPKVTKRATPKCQRARSQSQGLQLHENAKNAHWLKTQYRHELARAQTQTQTQRKHKATPRPRPPVLELSGAQHHSHVVYSHSHRQHVKNVVHRGLGYNYARRERRGNPFGTHHNLNHYANMLSK